MFEQENTLGLSGDAHERVPQHQIVPDNHREQTAGGGGGAGGRSDLRSSPLQADTPMTGNQTLSFQIKSFHSIGQSKPQSVFLNDYLL